MDLIGRELDPSPTTTAPTDWHACNRIQDDRPMDDDSKQVHGYPRAGENRDQLVVVPGVETIDVSGIDLSLLGHSDYGDSESMRLLQIHTLYGRLPR